MARPFVKLAICNARLKDPHASAGRSHARHGFRISVRRRWEIAVEEIFDVVWHTRTAAAV